MVEQRVLQVADGTQSVRKDGSWGQRLGRLAFATSAKSASGVIP